MVGCTDGIRWRPSKGSVGDGYDTTVCESFFAGLECELLDRSRFRNQAEARIAVLDHMLGLAQSPRLPLRDWLPLARPVRKDAPLSVRHLKHLHAHQSGATPLEARLGGLGGSASRDVVELRGRLCEALDEGPRQEARRLVAAIIEEVVVNEEVLRVRYRYPFGQTAYTRGGPTELPPVCATVLWEPRRVVRGMQG